MIKRIIAKQFRKPSGFLGKICAKLMDVGNLKTIDWVFSLMNVKEGEKILEIGYGSGILINKIADLGKNNLIRGLDFSKFMYKRATANCRSYIDKNIVKLFYGDLIDFENNTQFDKIVAINVIYFWDDLILYLNKINELLQKNGKVYLYFPDPKEMEKIEFTKTDIFNRRSKEDIVTELKKANFKNIIVETGRTNIYPAYCAIAEK